MLFNVGDVVRLKKPHPCGGYEWTLTRVGADMKLRCDTCGHVVMLDRQVFEKRVKKIIKSVQEDINDEEKQEG
ncbi:MAG: DUF951 domain-containing protein [Clostridia bacterium]|nr:DUF951 domain-containing protein [Clostridia bacterium]MBR5257742.1 DUF951 domain-containing protein [Clostridia bacterium]MBR5985838.1 DUF951 domain-containing protein [Clostridia bacterium]MBR6009022.1 DUF951 domain-containing protein [Clostridia bacterium]